MPFGRKRTWLSVVGIAMGASGVACSSLAGPSGPEISVSLTVQQPSASGAALFVTVGGRDVSLRASASTSQRTDASLEPGKFGTLPVRVVLLSSSADTLATVSFSQTFERGYTSWIGSFVSHVRPLGFCTGTVVAAPLRTSPSDTLFVMYGSIPEGAIC